MEQLPAEVLQPVDLGPLPPAQAAHTREEQVRRIFELLIQLPRLALRFRLPAEIRRRLGSRRSRARVAWAPDAEVPFACRLVVAGVHDAVLELDVVHELVFVDDGLEVGPDLGTGGVECRPIGLCEGGKNSQMRRWRMLTLGSKVSWYLWSTIRADRQRE